MPGTGADRTDAPAPEPEHARHRAPRAGAPRRAAVLLCLGLVAAAAAVLAVVLLQPAGDPGAVRAATSSGSAAPGGAVSSAPPASSSTQGSAQAAALWLAGQPSQSGAVAVDPELYDEVATSAQLASRLMPAPAQAPDGGLDARWVVAGPALRAEASPGSWAAQALAASRPVAVFGDGDARVEVREIGADAASASASAPVVPLAAGDDPTTSPPVTSGPARPTATAADAAALAELLRNPRLDFSPRARAALGSEQVDLRLAALLVQLAAQQPLSVSDLPASDGSEPVRTVVVDGLAGQAVGADPDALAVLQRQLAGQDPGYRATAEQAREGSTPVLRLTLPSAGA